ncbi:hypothetical protein K3495_g10790 [Podosphaera aphanis]|nr:hypothetical protein K3495_g10790 [Podosphaera aphanis]
MVPPARDKKLGLSEIVDVTKRIHKQAINPGRGQSSAAKLTCSAPKMHAVISGIAVPQGSLAVLPQLNPSDKGMDFDIPPYSSRLPEGNPRLEPYDSSDESIHDYQGDDAEVEEYERNKRERGQRSEGESDEELNEKASRENS